jgi:hypothetical protein
MLTWEHVVYYAALVMGEAAMVDPAPWLVLTDALAAFARDRLSAAWARYGEIAVELMDVAAPEEAARRRLLHPLRFRRADAIDYDAVGHAFGFAPTTTPAAARLKRLAQESWDLEQSFLAVLRDELQTGRWEGECISERDGRALQIPQALWVTDGLIVDTATNIVQPGKAPRLLGVRLRPVQAPKDRSPVQPMATERTAVRAPNPITLARRGLGPLIKREFERGLDRSVSATVVRLESEGRLTLPGNGEPENLRRELVREVRKIWNTI